MVVSANYFFIAIAALLLAILLFFKPTKLKEQVTHTTEVAELELKDFTLYEIGIDGLKDIMTGRQGYRFKDRIEINDINYTDSTHSLRNNVLADFGVYDNVSLITLEGNVRYYREDGMRFRSKKARIDQEKETINTIGAFTLDKDEDNIVGNDLFYDSKNGLSHAKDVTGYYTISD